MLQRLSEGERGIAALREEATNINSLQQSEAMGQELRLRHAASLEQQGRDVDAPRQDTYETESPKRQRQELIEALSPAAIEGLKEGHSYNNLRKMVENTLRGMGDGSQASTGIPREVVQRDLRILEQLVRLERDDRWSLDTSALSAQELREGRVLSSGEEIIPKLRKAGITVIEATIDSTTPIMVSTVAHLDEAMSKALAAPDGDYVIPMHMEVNNEIERSGFAADVRRSNHFVALHIKKEGGRLVSACYLDARGERTEENPIKAAIAKKLGVTVAANKERVADYTGQNCPDVTIALVVQSVSGPMPLERTRREETLAPRDSDCSVVADRIRANFESQQSRAPVGHRLNLNGLPQTGRGYGRL